MTQRAAAQAPLQRIDMREGRPFIFSIDDAPEGIPIVGSPLREDRRSTEAEPRRQGTRV